MKKALILSAMWVFVFMSPHSYSFELNDTEFLFKYNCSVDSQIPPAEFSEIISRRLKIKYHWKEVSTVNYRDELCISKWHFTYGNSQIWGCNIIIQRTHNYPGKIILSLEMKLLSCKERILSLNGKTSR
jgi:hypothetical protein